LQLQEELTKQNLTSENISRKLQDSELAERDLKKKLDEIKTKLNQSDSVKNNLTRQLESKERFLQKNNKKIEQLNSTIDGLTKRVEGLNWVTEWLCEHPENVSACKLESVRKHQKTISENHKTPFRCMYSETSYMCVL
jgi:chromosome segregation ATPase